MTGAIALASRLAVSAQEFINWTRNRDPMSTGWEFSQKDSLYHQRWRDELNQSNKY